MFDPTHTERPMAWKSTIDAWGSVTKTLHWLIATLVVVMACVGWYMKGLPNTPDKVAIYALHKSTGLTVLTLMLIRIGWRWYEGLRPQPPSGMPRWQQTAANATHVLLYFALLAMPVSGWLFNSASNFALRWYGLFSVPALSGPDPALKAFAGATHLFVFWLIALLLLLHVGAALQHHYVERDEVLRRMGWSRRR
jgi:cytochrome b561